MIDILQNCDIQYRNTSCCHQRQDCNCYECLREAFYIDKDDYICPKKHYYYVMNYGPSYASEIYHYLGHSHIIENLFNNRTINILSLGCGFSPDLIAVIKYINDNQNQSRIRYTGIDNSPIWQNVRRKYPHTTYYTDDLLNGFNLSQYNLVFIVKLFSTLKKNSLEDKFIHILRNEIINNMKDGDVLVFVDVNHYKLGRDDFDSQIKSLFSNQRYYYYNIENAYSDNYENIPRTYNVFNIPENLAVSPMRSVCKTIIFEYRK